MRAMERRGEACLVPGPGAVVQHGFQLGLLLLRRRARTAERVEVDVYVNVW